MRVSFLALLFLFASVVSAEEKNPADQSSENMKKAEHLLPGEEVITSTGKKMKVWTTEGPVPVSQAPEPFDTEKVNVDDVDLVIDGRRVPRPRPRDSFDVRKDPARP